MFEKAARFLYIISYPHIFTRQFNWRKSHSRVRIGWNRVKRKEYPTFAICSRLFPSITPGSFVIFFQERVSRRRFANACFLKQSRYPRRGFASIVASLAGVSTYVSHFLREQAVAVRTRILAHLLAPKQFDRF